MKLQRLLSLIICAAIALLACPAFAIEFNAEESFDTVFVITSGNALGSGFAIGENCVVTNAHVLSDPQNVILFSYSGERYRAFLLGKDDEADLAVLGIEGASFPYLKIGDYKEMNIGDDVYAIGAPKSMAYTLTKGVISSKERKMDDSTYIQTDAAINVGNSGGPLLNDKGYVIGVNTLKMVDSEGIGLSIPMDAVDRFLQSLHIERDANGNVPIAISPMVTEGESSIGVEGTVPDAKNEKMSTLSTIFLVGLCLSMGLNIVLIVVPAYQKRKNLTLKYDPRERTDFDIDILE